MALRRTVGGGDFKNFSGGTAEHEKKNLDGGTENRTRNNDRIARQ